MSYNACNASKTCDICEACNTNEGILNNDLIICEACMIQSSMKLITEANVIEKFVLTPDDFNGMRSAIGWSNNNNAMCNLYIRDDIEKLAIQKHGGSNGISKKIVDRESIRNNIVYQQNKIIENRRIKLDNHLLNIGLNGLRNDSVICQEYIDKGDKSGYTVESIGNIMLEMEFYFTKTNYRSELKKTRKNLRSIHKCHNKWISEDDVRIEAKKICLTQYVKDNIMNHDKIVDDVPPTMKEHALKIRDKLYLKMNKNKDKINTINNNKKNKQLLDYYNKKSKFEANKYSRTTNNFIELSKQLQHSLIE